MNNKVDFLEIPNKLILTDSETEFRPIMAKMKIIPIRSSIAIKIQEK